MSLTLEEPPVAFALALPRPPARSSPRVICAGRQLLGVTLLLLSSAPVYRLLDGRETGLAGAATVQSGDDALALLWSGTLLVLLVALLAARFMSVSALERWTERARSMLLRPSLTTLALGAAAVTVTLSALFSLLVLEGRPTLLDGMVQLLHARYLAAGVLAGPVAHFNEFWHIQNSLITPRGWVSQYPPGHVLLLALGLRAGAVWLVGPMLAGVTVFFTMLAAARLLPDKPATARLAGLLLAVSPFLICLAGSFMNHVTAAALLAVALYCVVRARDGHVAWALGAGVALSYALAVRPLSTLAAGAAIVLALWVPALNRDGLRRFGARIGFAAAGAAPFMVGLLAYNAHFFGHPLRFGYAVALGPATSLGFHRDPWGNGYGVIEAVAYTGADLLALGVALLETPLSAVALVGLYFLFARRLPAGVRVFAAWALVLVAANALYWHHGMHMGPRMLLEAAPAWALLTTTAALDLAGRLVPRGPWFGGRVSPRAGAAGGLIFAVLIGLTFLAPQRALSYGGGFNPITRIAVPETDGPSVVFVHDAWIGRLGMRLAVAGMSLDSVETALRQNPTCLVHSLASELSSRDEGRRARALAQLDMQPRARDLPAEAEIAPGNRIRVAEGQRLTGECLRQAQSDARGVLDSAPLLWLGDLPGLPGTGTLFVRDLGPEENARVLAAMPERKAYVYLLETPTAEPKLVGFEPGMALLWTAPRES